MPQILVFGDSIPAGAIDPEGGWVVRLRNYLIKNGYIDWSTFLYNMAVDVDNSTKVLSRINSETKCRIRYKDERSLFIFAFGLHDTCFWEDGRIVTDKKTFEKNVRGIIAWQKKTEGDAFFVGITPVYEKRQGQWLTRLQEKISRMRKSLNIMLFSERCATRKRFSL